MKKSPKSRVRERRTPLPEGVDACRAQHLGISSREIMTEAGIQRVCVNDSESPLAWLARRKGRDGNFMIDQTQFTAGERLRADFTRGQLSPRVTSSWSGIGRTRGSGGGAGDMTDLIVASRQRVGLAMEACGPELAGLLMDVCCFLRGLEDVERERQWPSRSAKVVLQLALDRLARHYGLRPAPRASSGAVRAWRAPDAEYTT